MFLLFVLFFVLSLRIGAPFPDVGLYIRDKPNKHGQKPSVWVEALNRRVAICCAFAAYSNVECAQLCLEKVRGFVNRDLTPTSIQAIVYLDCVCV